jgi:ankyrin repeat protein
VQFIEYTAYNQLSKCQLFKRFQHARRHRASKRGTHQSLLQRIEQPNIKIKHSIHHWRCAEFSLATEDIVGVELSRMSSLEEFANAIEKGDSSSVESLISRGVVDVNARLPRPRKPPALVRAAYCGEKEIVDILLRANARIDETDERDSTACHAAANRGHHDVLALLLARQPNLAIVDTLEETALCCAARASADDGGRSALMLLEAGASVELVDRGDLCSLASKSATNVRALIDHGVVVREIVDSNGATPLHLATWDGRDVDVFDILVNVCGIDLDARDYSGSTCVLFAALLKNVVSLRWLIEAGADVNVADNDGVTQLHDTNGVDCAVLLLAAGASVCVRDNSGRTALHRFAREQSDLTAVHALLAAGADLDVANDAGETARQALARRGWTIDPDQVEAARREIAKTRIDFVRYRALQVCIGLHSLDLNALQMCEILLFACGPIAPLIPFHVWWKIATTVKHFQTK